jgi:XTP/dITP diphosphohydrolase
MRSGSDGFLLATRSTDKLAEIRAIFPAPLRAALLSLDDIGLQPAAHEDEIEAHETFAENAVAKAEFFRRETGLPTIADDSGLVVPALGGRPGVRSKRFAGRADLGAQALDEANNAALLAALHDVPKEKRSAYYVCAAVLVGMGAPIIALGTTAGLILDAPIGHGGFGYDPLFFHPAIGRTFGEIASSAKHTLSHRGRAFRALSVMVGGNRVQ